MRDKISKLSPVAFFIIPWTGFIMSFSDLRTKRGAFIYIAFAVVFGFSISFTNTSADSIRYAQAFAEFDNNLDYNAIMDMYRSGELRDIYRLLLFYITSLFTKNPKVLFALAGLVFGMFSYLSLRLILNEFKGKSDIYVAILILIFYNLVSLSNINGFKFWTGALLLFYSLYNAIILNKNRWIIGILITPLFHYGFIMFMPIVIAYRLFGFVLYNKSNVRTLLFCSFIVTFVASWVLETNAINLGFIAESDVISGEIGGRLNYLNSDRVSEIVQARTQVSLFLGVQKYFGYSIKIYTFIIVVYLWKLLKKYNGNKIEFTRLLSAVMFFYSVAYIASSFPSGGRFMSIAHMLLFILFAKFYNINKSKRMQRLILFSLPVFSFNVAFANLMLPLMILSPTFWYGNIFWILIEGTGFYM